MNRRIVAAPAVLLLAAGLALTGCASPSPAASSPDEAPRLGEVSPGLPDGPVMGQGTVLEVGDGAELCLGPVAESAPPQCSGIPLVDWTWDGVEGVEENGGVRWGSFAVQGTYDGKTLTVTQPPIMLALYDPMPLDDPTGGEPGAGAEADLLRIQDELPGRLGDAYFASYPQDGWLFVDVLWDDGTWQDAANGEYGADTVIIRSALREIG